ncbi:MAG TPA: MupA/Atu3671 family FMN-dependent luciferase-like monooxygenase [Myxococcota bacterium]
MSSAEPSRFSCFAIGDESLLIQCGEQLLGAGHELRGLLTRAAAPLRWAGERGIPCFADWDALREAASARPFDYLFSITNLSVVPRDLLSLPRRAAINFHDGPLPHYAGLNTPMWGLLRSEPRWGITWHLMTDAVDAGQVLREESFEIAGGETSLTLNARCYEAAVRSFPALIEDLAAGRAQPRAQAAGERRVYRRHERPAAACALDWTRDAASLSALVRALDFGTYANPIGLPKLWLGGEAALVRALEIREDLPAAPPGVLVACDEDGITVGTGSHPVELRSLTTPLGAPLSPAELAARFALRPGARLPAVDEALARRLSDLDAALAPQESHWSRRLAALAPPPLPLAESEPGASLDTLACQPSPSLRRWLAGRPGGLAPEDALFAAFAAWLGRTGEFAELDLGLSDAGLRERVAGLDALFAAQVPVRVEIAYEEAADAWLARVATALADARRRASFACDLVARQPGLAGLREAAARFRLPVTVVQGSLAPGELAARGQALSLLVPAGAAAWSFEAPRLSRESLAQLARQFEAFLEGLAAAPSAPLGRVSLLSAEERQRVLVAWNDTAGPVPGEPCVHQQFERQVDRTPDAVALVFRGQKLSYRELDARANQLAAHLRELGVGPDVPVGVCTERSLEMMVATLAVQKAGGAYVPIDPGYPKERIALMVEDSQVPVLITQQRLLGRLPRHQARVVCLDAEWPEIAKRPATRTPGGAGPENLAYLIYTSGSTGRPKGVMVEHRNVSNFFAGMDTRVAHPPGSVWLAVTSLSFDISVLELFWTLARGFRVVIHDEEHKTAASSAARTRLPSQPIDFSLFYFASDEGEHAADKYRLLLDGARFADARGFAAIWTPERHFHAFGGLYPNPSVASAAVAAITQRIGIRAGSCVSPLHHPIRIAEEWALVDNLSGGRVGISFASGWQPDDFVLRPESHARAKQVMVENIDTVRRLWRGEKLSFPGPRGEVAVRTLPRPVQPELPVWITTAGNPETFRMAGELGANVLTHLLGQSVDEVGEKLRFYRQAWKDAGHAGAGFVTLMLHTFVSDDGKQVRETVREPLKDYLRSSASLIKQYASSFPAFKGIGAGSAADVDRAFQNLSDEDMDALLEHSFGRYYETSGLFGTPGDCVAMVDRLKQIGVDEVACLIDFGIDSEKVFANLTHLDELRERCAARAEAETGDFSIAAQLRREQVTHLQCTPSMAGMLLADPETRGALGQLGQLLVGGEACAPELARDLASRVPGPLLNMYGPTETTIWSTSQRLAPGEGPVPIGRPILNTRLYVLDARQEPVPPGVAGELWIGGAGVVRGYFGRPELTAERFLPDRFAGEPGARMYRTGDRVRYRPDGIVDFLGRIDHQVKLRGYRIELGEIESLLRKHSGVRDAVVVMREDAPGDKRLVAYVIPEAGVAASAADLRAHVRERLPEFMVPAAVMLLDAFPLTPNQKIDRRALPAPDAAVSAPTTAYVAPASDLETTVARVWQEVLQVAQVGMQDNFFDLGGHSLLIVQVLEKLRKATGLQLPMTDLFRFPTIRSLVDHLSAGGDDGEQRQRTQDRADARRESMLRRRQRRQRG